MLPPTFLTNSSIGKKDDMTVNLWDEFAILFGPLIGPSCVVFGALKSNNIVAFLFDV
jgi:hypothetical protein